MIGLGSNLVNPPPPPKYKHIWQLSNYGDLDVYFDFSLLSADHGSEVVAVTNLSSVGTPSNYNITSNVGNPLVDTSTMVLTSIAFDGASDDILNMANAWTSSDKEFTLFMTLKKSDGTNDFFITKSSDDISSSIKITGTDNANVVIDMTDIGSPRTIALNNTNPSSSTVNYSMGTVNTSLVVRRTSAGNVAIYAQEGLYVAFNSNVNLQNGSTFTWGAIGGSESSTDWGGNIGEVGIYDADIGEDNAIILVQELAKKWGAVNP